MFLKTINLIQTREGGGGGGGVAREICRTEFKLIGNKLSPHVIVQGTLYFHGNHIFTCKFSNLILSDLTETMFSLQ